MVEAEDRLIFKLRGKGKSSAELKPQAVEAAKPEVEEAVAPQVVEAPASARVTEPSKPKGSGFSFAGIFGKREEAARPAAQAPVPLEVERPVEEPYAASQTFSIPEKAESITGRERESAKGKFCEWHPWRPAYAVCDYCHRPFCYEDTVESGKGYYCLGDIDKVSKGYAQELYASYSSMSFISAGLFMLAFVAFVYFASGQLVYILKTVISSGLPVFLANLNYSYGSALLGLVVTAAGIISAMLIVIQSNKGFAVGLGAGLAETALFSYQFLSSGLLYMAMISAIGLAALVLLAYSKISYVVPEQTLSEQSVYYSSQNANQSSPVSF